MSVPLMVIISIILVPILKNKSNNDGPTFIHVVTKKGKGYAPAETSEDKFHGYQSLINTQGKTGAKKYEPTSIYKAIL